MTRTVAILTISDRGARGDYEDRSGALLAQMIQSQSDLSLVSRSIVPDEIEQIAAMLNGWCVAGVNLILTTGGTGFAPRDVTPEATRQVIEREAPGIAEALRAESLKVTRHAMLSRGIAGLRGQSLIINLPGNPKAVKESMDILWPVLPHALDLLMNRDRAEKGHRQI